MVNGVASAFYPNRRLIFALRAQPPNALIADYNRPMFPNTSVPSVPERPVLPPRSGRPRLITVLLITKLLLSLFALLAVFEQNVLIDDLRAAMEQMGPRSVWEMRNFDRSSMEAWERALAFAMAAGLFVSVGLFGEMIRWLHAMHLNLPALGGKPRFHSRWAIPDLLTYPR